MKFKRLVASFLMGATLVSGVSVPVIFADTNTYASTFAEINYSSSQVNMDGIKAFVTRMYKVCLDREPEEEGLNGWAQKLAQKEATGCSVAYGFVFSPEFIGKNPTNEAFVNYMYDAFFGRTPDEGGFKYWVDYLNNGATKESVFCGFANSQEFSNLCSNYGVVRGFHIEGEDFNRIALINLFVERLYNVVLDRTCDEVGMPGWTVKLNSHEESGCSVAYGFVFSPEFLNKHTCNDCYVEILYNAFLGRSSDTSGKSSWVSMLNEGKSRELVFNGFAGSPEFAGICSEYGIEPGSLSTEGTTHAEGTCTICGNTNSNGSSNGGATNNGGSTSGNDSSNNGSTNGSSSTGSGSSNSGSNNGSTNNGGTTGNTTNGNTGSTTPTSTPTSTTYPRLTPPTKIGDISFKGTFESGFYTVTIERCIIYDGMYEFDNYMFYVDEDGFLITGWVDIDDDYETTVYFKRSDGEVYIETKTIPVDEDGITLYFDPDTGLACDGLTEIDDEFYYFINFNLATGKNFSTVFYTGKDHCFFVDEQGIVQTSGWQMDDWHNKYYVDSSTHETVTGWQDIDGNTYYFDEFGCMRTGDIKIDSTYYFFNSDGILQTQPGWYIVGIKRFYLDNDGKLVTGWQTIDGKKYYFNRNALTGLVHFSDNRYRYFDDNGVMQTNCWCYGYNVNGKWGCYYVDSDGKTVKDWQTIGGKKYYFNSDCMVQFGWLTLDTGKYYFDSHAAMQTGWQQIEGEWYYFNEDGSMVADDWIPHKGKWCYLKEDGIMAQSKWIQWKSNWYYIDDEGYMATGERTINGVKYYFYTKADEDVYEGASEGAMAKNVTINGITYGANGKGQ
ncbi:MAG: DUF4214 domain-containing protein [Clostridia bacterium]|nr:DUF4214 domain-containing protein [Clostridia bacterium]